MANRRMFSKRITNSGRFLKMPPSSQSLYFHLAMDADDDGVVEAFNVLKLTNSNDDDLRVLTSKGFVKILNEDLVAVIMDWTEHNLIRADRKVDSIYKDLLLQIVPDVKRIEPKERADTGKTTGRPLDNQMSAQVRLGKDRIGKVNIISKEIGAKAPDPSISLLLDFLKEKVGGSLDDSIKTNRRYCFLLINRIKKDYPDKDPVKGIQALIMVGLRDKFHAKNITNFKYLFYNAQKIAQSFRGNTGKVILR